MSEFDQKKIDKEYKTKLSLRRKYIINRQRICENSYFLQAKKNGIFSFFSFIDYIKNKKTA